MSQAADKIYLLGGYWKDVVDIQQAAATTLGRNVILTSGSYEKLYETARALTPVDLAVSITFCI